MSTLESDGTPLQYTSALAGNFKHRSTLLTTTEVKVQLAQGMKCRWIGPVPVQDIMTELMPIKDKKLEEYNKRRDKVSFQSLKPQKRTEATGTQPKEVEKDLYTRFANAIQRHDLSPRMPFFISADKKRTNTDPRPDGGLEEEKEEGEDEDEEDEEKKKGQKEKEEKELYRVEPTHRYATRSKAAAAAVVAAPWVSQESTVTAPKKTTISEPRPFDWCLDTLVVEFKGANSDDPFRSETTLKRLFAKGIMPVCFEKDTVDARKVRGQLALYAREMFNHQQRTHIFQLLIAGDIARIIYFDHAGAIVSESIDYVKEGGTLGEFFWRINYMTDKARGLDMTAVRANQGDREVFTSVVKQLVANMDDSSHPQRRIPDAELTLDDKYPVYKMTVHEGVRHKAENKQGGDEEPVHNKSEVATMELLVQRPIFDASSPLGRATRGYIAVPATTKETSCDKQESDGTCKEEKPVSLFLKDTWRVDHAMLKAESEIYRLLEKYGVERIPRLVCGGDVRDNDGQVQRTISAEWVKRVRRDLGLRFAELRAHLHHRLVQRLAYPIESATRSEEMVKAFDDVLGVIEEAYEKVTTKVLHRDISFGNVMLGDDEDEKIGLLADWDHASETEPESDYKHQLFRTGTWPFMSISLLENPNKRHEILDDLEAMFWTLLYASLHRFSHQSKLNLNFFNWYEDEQSNGLPTGKILGGNGKRAALTKIQTDIKFTCEPLQTLITTLASELRKYHIQVDDAKILEGNLKANPTDVHLKEQCDAACAARDAMHAKLSSPAYWRSFFKMALAKKDAWMDDVLTEVMYHPRTAEQGLQLFEATIATSTLRTTTPTRQVVEEAQGEQGHGGATSEEDDGDNESDNLDSTFIPIPEAGRNVGSPDLGPSPPTSPSHQLHITSFVSGYHSSSSEDDGPATPSKKRTHEDLDGAVARPLTKRHRSTDMPPPALPPRAIAGRSGQSRRAPASGDKEGATIPGPSKYRSRE